MWGWIQEYVLRFTCTSCSYPVECIVCVTMRLGGRTERDMLSRSKRELFSFSITVLSRFAWRLDCPLWLQPSTRLWIETGVESGFDSILQDQRKDAVLILGRDAPSATACATACTALTSSWHRFRHATRHTWRSITFPVITIRRFAFLVRIIITVVTYLGIRCRLLAGASYHMHTHAYLVHARQVSRLHYPPYLHT